jgi:hypothetical protein
MPKNPLDVLEAKLQRSLSAGAFENGRHVWWNGPSDGIKLRDLAKGPDPYHTFDRDGHIRKCMDHRWRRIDCQDKTQAQKFGPNPRDIDLNPDQRPAMAVSLPRQDGKESRPASWKTNPDPYGINLKNTFLGTDKSRSMVFPRINRQDRKGRFSTPTLFGKDYTILAGR